jgi:hypothetical protein
MNTLCSENHTKLNAGCAMAQTVGRLPSHRVEPDSMPGQLMWDLWCTDCRWDKFYSEFCDFPRQYYFTNAPRSFTLISYMLNNLTS